MCPRSLGCYTGRRCALAPWVATLVVGVPSPPGLLRKISLQLQQGEGVCCQVAKLQHEWRIFIGIMGTFHVVPIMRAMVESNLADSKCVWIIQDSPCRTDVFISRDLTDNNRRELNNLQGHRAGDFDLPLWWDHFRGSMCGSARIEGSFLQTSVEMCFLRQSLMQSLRASPGHQACRIHESCRTPS